MFRTGYFREYELGLQKLRLIGGWRILHGEIHILLHSPYIIRAVVKEYYGNVAGRMIYVTLTKHICRKTRRKETNGERRYRSRR